MNNIHKKSTSSARYTKSQNHKVKNRSQRVTPDFDQYNQLIEKVEDELNLAKTEATVNSTTILVVFSWILSGVIRLTI